MRSAAWNELKLPQNCRYGKPPHAQLTIVTVTTRGSAVEFIVAPEDIEVVQGFQKHAILWFVGAGV